MNSAARGEESGIKATARLEALCAGVLAIAITLLVLELKVPHGPRAKPRVSGAPDPLDPAGV